MALVLVRKVGSGPGMYEPHPKVPAYGRTTSAWTTVGVALIFSGLPMVSSRASSSSHPRRTP